MNKKEAIELLHNEGWTKADAKRALSAIDFKTNSDVEEIIILRTASQFAGAELLNRQRLQAAQKGMVTKKNKEIQQYIVEIEELTRKISISSEKETVELNKQIVELKTKIGKLIETNDSLKKDNKNLKNIVDEIRFKITVEFKHLLQLQDSDIKKGLIRLLKSTLG